MEWEKQYTRELDYIFSHRGKELQLCLVAQGYENNLFIRLMFLLGSGFAALKIIQELKKEITSYLSERP